MVPYSIDIAQRVTGEWQVLVANRGAEEAVEFYELTWDAQRLPRLTWRGCVAMPDQLIGQITTMADGLGFVATQMHPVTWDVLAIRRALTNLDPVGRVVIWRQGQRLRILPSAIPYILPYGALMALDGESVYTTQFGSLLPVVSRRRLSDGAILAEVALVHPLGMAWTPEGKLLVVDADSPAWEWMLCNQWPRLRPCVSHFSLWELDPQTLEPLDVVLAHRGPPLGTVSHIMVTSGTLYMGSGTGDRLVRTTWPPSRRHDRPPATALEASATSSVTLSAPSASTAGATVAGSAAEAIQ